MGGNSEDQWRPRLRIDYASGIRTTDIDDARRQNVDFLVRFGNRQRMRMIAIGIDVCMSMPGSEYSTAKYVDATPYAASDAIAVSCMTMAQSSCILSDA
jgi:hypothetical protein